MYVKRSIRIYIKYVYDSDEKKIDFIYCLNNYKATLLTLFESNTALKDKAIYLYYQNSTINLLLT